MPLPMKLYVDMVGLSYPILELLLNIVCRLYINVGTIVTLSSLTTHVRGVDKYDHGM